MDPDARNDNGDTALHLAAEQGNFLSLRELVRHGADLSIENNNGETAADCANRQGKNAACKFLLSAEDGHGFAEVEEIPLAEVVSAPYATTRKQLG